MGVLLVFIRDLLQWVRTGTSAPIPVCGGWLAGDCGCGEPDQRQDGGAGGAPDSGRWPRARVVCAARGV